MLLLPCDPISNEVIPDIYVPIPFANLLSAIIIHFGGALLILCCLGSRIPDPLGNISSRALLSEHCQP